MRSRWIGLLGVGVLLLGSACTLAAETRLDFWGLSSDAEIAVVDEFNKRNAGRIRIEPLPGISGSEMLEKLSVAIAANAAPDVVRFDRFAIAEFADKGLFRPLNDILRRDDFDSSDFYPAAWNETVYEGKTYGIPWQMDARAYVYNKTVFAESGLDPATPPRSWEETLSMSRKLDRRTPDTFTRMGFLAHGGNWYFLGWLLTAGGSIVDESGRNVAWNSKAGRRAANFMVDVANSYGGYGAAQTVLGGSVSTAIVKGRLASVVDYSGFVASALGKDPNIDLGVGPAPRPAELAHEKISWSGGYALCIPITTPDSKMDAAWQFVRFYTSKEGMILAFQSESSSRLPTRRSVVMDVTYANKQPAALAGFMELLPHSRFRPVSPDGASLYGLYKTRMEDMLLKQGVVPDQALDETARLGQIVLNQRWAQGQ